MPGMPGISGRMCSESVDTCSDNWYDLVMFNPRVVFGEQAAVWSSAGVDDAEPRLRVLLPDQGSSVQDRARSAEFVPSIQQDRRRPRGRVGKQSRITAVHRHGARDGAVGRGQARRVALPGDLSGSDRACTVLLGHPGGGPAETDRMQRSGLSDGAIEALAAVYDLQHWQRRVTTLPPADHRLRRSPAVLAIEQAAGPYSSPVRPKPGFLYQRTSGGWISSWLRSVGLPEILSAGALADSLGDTLTDDLERDAQLLQQTPGLDCQVPPVFTAQVS